MRLISEDQLLDKAIRAKVIQEINGAENVTRRDEAFRRHDVYRDHTKKWVRIALEKEELKKQTIEIMINRAANISICRKIINKLARCYMGGVNRSGTDDAQTKQINDMAKILEVDAQMKKADRYSELQKNCRLDIMPELVEYDGEAPRYGLKVRVRAPWEYDVIEKAKDPECALAVIYSEFYNPVTSAPVREGDGVDQIIADQPGDQGIDKKLYIFWTDKYHFTCDEQGEIIASRSPEELLNPIGVIPSVNIAADQDGYYWAQGGEDIIDGSVLVNLLLTDMYAIARLQGYGQMVISGKNINENLVVGPHNALVLNQDAGDPEPRVYFASASSQQEAWMKSIEQYVALLLSTNNLSPTNVASSLSSASFPSGIALLIEQSEATGTVEDKQKLFSDAERQMWEILALWQNLYFDRGLLTDEFKQIGSMGEPEVLIKFNAVRQVITEKEKLEAIKLRKDLGINEMVDLILIDNPDMSRDDAEEKLKAITAEKMQRQASMISSAIGQAQPTSNSPGSPDGSKPPFPPKQEASVNAESVV